jgi:GNAT superfamily N-acetyltransferase
MSSVEIRPFARADREQLTGLVNAHIAAVLPGVSVPVNAVMSQLEREPGEPIVDPWVVERRTLVAVERDAVVAGAHLLRYGSDERVSESYRNAGEIRWLVFLPDSAAAGEALAAACLDVLDGWRVDRQYADGSLPSLATYGVPACWPHIRELYGRSGFVFQGRVEIILVACVDELPRALEPPIPELGLQRSVGVCGTRFSALLNDEAVGMIEVESDLTAGGTRSRFAGWSDVGNLCVREDHRRQGIATWLLATTADWLRLGFVERLVDYAWPEQEDLLGFLGHVGFRELVRTERGWRRVTSG